MRRMGRGNLILVFFICKYLRCFENVKTTYGEKLLLVKLQASACNITKSNIPPWVFFTFLWYQIARKIAFIFYDSLSVNLNFLATLATLIAV